ncbi:MAG: thiamine phosphate synthase [Mariprofundus sp.]|nr:thiamine phosphate synthase [Mariprofundus sp.]
MLASVPNRVPQLTLITDTTRFSGESFFSAVQQALLGGVDAVLVREKQLTSAKLLALASRLRQMTHDARARLIIHSQVDVACAVDADGIHLASAEIQSIPAVRQWLADTNKTVSVSCHNSGELIQASELDADYAMLSPVFATASHPGAVPLGLEAFRALASAATLPVIALGGIGTDSCKLLQGMKLAVIGAVLGAEDPCWVAQQLLAASRGEAG